MQRAGLRILVADDHELVREGLKRILLDSKLVGTVGEAVDAASTLALCGAERWDAVILDLNMPGRSGLDLLKDLKRQYPALPVLVLSMYPEEQFAVRVLRAGADGYLTKGTAAQTLRDAILRISRGQKFISSSVAEQLVEALNQPRDSARHEALSDREDQVVRQIASGLTVGEIAEQLSLSVKTISTYRAGALRKLGLKNNAQIMRYAQDHGLVE